MILPLLQLSSPALPLGAYSYSDGLETLVETGSIANAEDLNHWLIQDLNYGAIRLEAALMMRAFQSFINQDVASICYWNSWLSASKETSELRRQSWQMGNSLLALMEEIYQGNDGDHDYFQYIKSAIDKPCNYAIAFGITAAHSQIDPQTALLGYLHSWATHIIGAGVKLIPLGQTIGQKLLWQLSPTLTEISQQILLLNDDDLVSCSWGLGLASMAHEIQYTRLFRS
ncbi:MAG: urease accessory protein UreF [Arthrospira sp. SH-MAG29]|nr:urease accessory protein UreF [Arthrospira sp. SH-MAG29]MBS0017585.1 urease accessory protein UreF [Arthrospira sp. SH-MAG29]